MNQKLSQSVRRNLMFLPLTASTTLEVKNDYAQVITQDICNKFIEINVWVGYVVSQPNRLFQRLTTMSLINTSDEIYLTSAKK